MADFISEKLTEHITRIKDISNTYFYLIEGKNQAILLDTGIGFGKVREFVDSICKKDYFVVLTHAHLDHIGGIGEFLDKKIYMSSLDEPIVKENLLISKRKEYVKNIINDIDSFPSELISPEKVNLQFENLKDGQEFDLGNLHVQMIPCPGHTLGMFTALIKEDRYCMFGDACGVFVMLFNDQSYIVSKYLKSLQKLKKHEDEFDYIIRNHGTGESPKDLLDNVIECCNLILDGKDDHYPIEFMGNKLFAAKKLTKKFGRVDGKEGNIMYRADKAK